MNSNLLIHLGSELTYRRDLLAAGNLSNSEKVGRCLRQDNVQFSKGEKKQIFANYRLVSETDPRGNSMG